MKILEKLIINQVKAQVKIKVVINFKNKTLFKRTILPVILKSIQVQKVSQVKNNQFLKVFKAVRKILKLMMPLMKVILKIIFPRQ